MEKVIKFIQSVQDYRQHRLSVCGTCDKNKFGICEECACIIQTKVLLEDSECPLNKW